MIDYPLFRAARPLRTVKLRHHHRLVVGFSLGVLAGLFLTTEEAAALCVGEKVDLIEPVVTVVDGPGDPTAEAALWSTFERIQFIGPDEFHVGGTVAFMEVAP